MLPNRHHPACLSILITAALSSKTSPILASAKSQTSIIAISRPTIPPGASTGSETEHVAYASVARPGPICLHTSFGLDETPSDTTRDKGWSERGALVRSRHMCVVTLRCVGRTGRIGPIHVWVTTGNGCFDSLAGGSRIQPRFKVECPEQRTPSPRNLTSHVYRKPDPS